MLIENQVQDEETMFFICHMIISLQTISSIHQTYTKLDKFMQVGKKIKANTSMWLLNKFGYEDFTHIKCSRNCLTVFNVHQKSGCHSKLLSLKTKKPSVVQNFALFVSYKMAINRFEFVCQWSLCYLNCSSTEDFWK